MNKLDLDYFEITNKAFNIRTRNKSLKDKVHQSTFEMLLNGKYSNNQNAFEDHLENTRRILEKKFIGDNFKNKFNQLYPKQNKERKESKHLVEETMQRILMNSKINLSKYNFNSNSQTLFYNPKESTLQKKRKEIRDLIEIPQRKPSLGQRGLSIKQVKEKKLREIGLGNTKNIPPTPIKISGKIDLNEEFSFLSPNYSFYKPKQNKHLMTNLSTSSMSSTFSSSTIGRRSYSGRKDKSIIGRKLTY